MVIAQCSKELSNDREVKRFKGSYMAIAQCSKGLSKCQES